MNNSASTQKDSVSTRNDWSSTVNYLGPTIVTVPLRLQAKIAGAFADLILERKLAQGPKTGFKFSFKQKEDRELAIKRQDDGGLTIKIHLQRTKQNSGGV